MTNQSRDTTPPTKKHAKRRKIKVREPTAWDVFMTIIFYCGAIALIFGLTYKVLTDQTSADIWSNTLSVTGQGEMSVRELGGQLNTMYCQSYNITSLTSRDVYLTSGTAKVTKEPSQSITHYINRSQILPFKFNNWFYLLEGSNIRINACRTNHTVNQTQEHVDILIFKGKDSLTKWEETYTCEMYCERNTTVPLDAFCDEGQHAVLSYDVKERDTYYVGVVRRDIRFYDKTNIFAELNVSQTTFDIKGAKKICTMKTECNVPVDFESEVDVVLGEVNPLYTVGVQHVWVTCFMRMPFWVGIFIVIPAILIVVGVVAMILIFLNQQKKKHSRKQMQREDCEQVEVKGRDNAALVVNEVPSAQ